MNIQSQFSDSGSVERWTSSVVTNRDVDYGVNQLLRLPVTQVAVSRGSFPEIPAIPAQQYPITPPPVVLLSSLRQRQISSQTHIERR